MTDNFSNILIIAPHADDEILGCGGVIAKYAKNGGRVSVAVMTQGSSRYYSREAIELVRQETLKAHDLLNISETFFFDFPAPGLESILKSDINNKLAKLINRVRPTSIFLPFIGDVHSDHVEIFKSSMVALRPISSWQVAQVFAYETLSETNWNAPYLTPSFIPNTYVDISDTIDIKIAAFKCFQSQQKKFPHERSIEAIKALAVRRGTTVHKAAAEAFVMLRQIID